MQMHHFFNRIFSLHIPGISPVFKYKEKNSQEVGTKRLAKPFTKGLLISTCTPKGFFGKIF